MHFHADVGQAVVPDTEYPSRRRGTRIPMCRCGGSGAQSALGDRGAMVARKKEEQGEYGNRIADNRRDWRLRGKAWNLGRCPLAEEADDLPTSRVGVEAVDSRLASGGNAARRKDWEVGRSGVLKTASCRRSIPLVL